MIKADLIKEVSKETGIESAAVGAVIEGFMKSVKGSLVRGDNVYLRGFGTFKLKTRKAKIGRDIKKNTSVAIPEHRIPTFKPSAELKKAVK